MPDPAPLSEGASLRPSAPGTPPWPPEIDEIFGESPENLLIWGENLTALDSLGRTDRFVDLVYIDPPFDSGRTYSARLDVGPALPAYDDTWGTAAYLEMLRPRVHRLRDLLSPTGVLCVHIDNHAGNYVGVLLDEIFGPANFVNEIIWRYGKMSNATRRFANSHDRILVYAKSPAYYFAPLRSADSEYRIRFARYLVDNKVHYGTVSANTDKLITGRARRIERELGRPLQPDDVLFDFDHEFKTQDDVFYDISIVKGNAGENAGFHTQKPVKLLDRLIAAYCPPGGLVLDCFAGSGTTAVAAAQSGRPYIAIDNSRLAIHTMRKRLLALPSPFTLVDQRLARDAPVEIELDVRWDGSDVTVALCAVSVPGHATAGWPDLVDYWAIDFGAHPTSGFTIDWYSTRGGPDGQLVLAANHRSAGDCIRVRVVDLRAHTTEVTVRRPDCQG